MASSATGNPMRALRICGPGTAELTRLPTPTAGDDEVLVEVATAAICATDRKLTARGAPLRRVLGHEAAGHLLDGTAVGIHPDTGCGRCAHCRKGQTNWCADKTSIGIDRDGGLAGLVSVPRAHAVPLEGVPLDVAPLLEPLACCVHAVRRVGPFEGPAVVVGAGAMGILLMWALQADGHRVAMSQRSPQRRRQAKDLGADVVITPDQDVAQALGATPAAIFVTAPGADALTWAMERVDVGGSVHSFAGTPGGALIDANTVHYRHIDLVGSTGSGLVDYVEGRDMVRRGAVDLSRLPHRRTDLTGGLEALTTTRPDDGLRVLVDITGDDR